MSAFHYAFKVKDIDSTRKFYVEILGCEEGRSTENWIDFNFFGNQLSAHVSKNLPDLDYCGNVDGVMVPIPHFGCLLEKELFNKILEKLRTENIEFLVKPYKRYKGKILFYQGKIKRYQLFFRLESRDSTLNIDVN